MGLPENQCPLCGIGAGVKDDDILELLNRFVSANAYAGKWVSVDVPTDILVAEAVVAKGWLYKVCKEYNRTTKGKVRFNLDSLK
jgi:hypothetical protein